MFSNNGNNQWMWIAAILFFGYGIFSTISFGVVTALGMPYEWSLGLATLMTGAAIYLVYNRYSALGWALMGCVGFILVSVLAILRGVAAPEPIIPADLRPYIEEQAVLNPFDPASYEAMGTFGTADLLITPDETRQLLYTYDEYTGMPVRNFPLTIQFPSQEALDAQWAFEEGELSASGGLTGRFRAIPADNYNSGQAEEFYTTEGSQLQSFTPYLVVAMPLQGTQLDKTIHLEVELTLMTPDESGQPQSQTLTRQAEVLVASDNFYMHQTDYETWHRSRRVVETPLWMLLVVGSVISAGASWALVQRGALEKGGAGDFVMIVRRRGGLEHLGAEAHPLSKVDASATSGVVLGFVNAQSPAGRAGLRAGDQVTGVDTKPVQSPKELDNALKKYKRGNVATLTISRHGDPLEIPVKF